MNWQRLDLLTERFEANCRVLATRQPTVASALCAYVPPMPLVLSAQDDRLLIARLKDKEAQVLPFRFDPLAAQHLIHKLCPTGLCTDSILIVGIDQGWIWQQLHQLECAPPARPGYRPPLYFLTASIEHLWIALHIHDWRTMLADPRVQLIFGADAIPRLLAELSTNSRMSGPRVAMTIEQEMWPQDLGLDALNQRSNAALTTRLAATMATFPSLYAGADDRALAARLTGSVPLRVMGITSRHTTFLQHSMRDWLAAFASAGHQTHLLIENASHEQLNSLALAETCAAFKPDLILMIDHFRRELGGLPENIPCVMWIQDNLPNIFTLSAGAAQGPHDYTIGYNRIGCVGEYGYPERRFMSAPVAVNEQRFAPLALSEDDRRTYECDVCYVSHASTPAESVIAEQVALHPQARRLLQDVFGRLKAIYDQGHCVTHPLHIKAALDSSIRETGELPSPQSHRMLLDMLMTRVNNALLRHQALEWAAEMGASLHIYGKGWERHPRLGKFARGPADNATALAKIYSAARIQLQVTPNGAVHQRLLEGLAAGGFFLIRHIPGDALDRIYRPLWDWCQRENIYSDDEIMSRATPEIYQLLGQLQRTLGLDPFKLEMPLIEDLRNAAELDFRRSADGMWPEYDEVAFDSRRLLHHRIKYYLDHPDQRARVARSMRRRVLETHTYTSINQRMLRFIADDLRTRVTTHVAAA